MSTPDKGPSPLSVGCDTCGVNAGEDCTTGQRLSALHLRCSDCPASFYMDAEHALAHERAEGHRVVYWDTPTSQMPRWYWAGEKGSSS